MQVSCATIIDPAGGPTTISCHVAPELLKPTSTLIGMRTHSHATMADLAAEAGAGTELIQYLEDRGVRAPATLALLAQDELETVLLQPLLTGWKTKAGSAITLAESEKPIAKAILRHMWNLARSSWQAQLSAARPAAPSAPDPATVTSSGSSTKDDKVPKTLPAGVWSKAIQAYESQQIGGCDRTGGYQQESQNQRAQPSSWTSNYYSQDNWQQDQKSSWSSDQWHQAWSKPKK